MLNEAQLEVRGPGWVAIGTVVEYDEPPGHRALALLQAAAGRNPGSDRESTAFVRLRIESATATLAAVRCRWQPAEESELVADAVVALGRTVAGRRRASLLAGELPMAFMEPPAGTPLERLHGVIGVIPRPHSEPILTPDGVVVVGHRTLPWDDDVVTGPFVAMPSAGRTVTVTPQLSRLAPWERAEWTRSWQRFAGVIDGHRESTRSELHWMRLAVLTADAMPAISFEVTSGRAGRTERIVLPPGSLAVELTDRARGNPRRPQRSVLRLHPTTTHIEGDRIVLVGHDPDADATPELSVGVSLSDDDRWESTVSLRARFEPDPVALAARLDRADEPTPADDGGVEVGAVYTRLADGWLETAAPAVADQDYVDRSIDRGGVDASGLAEGAVIWGNDDPDARSEPELVGRTRWNLAVLDAAGFRSEWTIVAREVRAGALDLFGLGASLDGVWTIAERGSTSDRGLPDSGRWVGELGTVALHCGASLAQRRPSAIAIDIDADIMAVTLGGDDADETNDDVIVGELTTVGATLQREPDVADALGFPGLGGTAWLRHPNVPTIQALPLDGRSSASGAPSGTRELMPMTLVPAGTPWTLRGDEFDWLRIADARLQPRADWVERRHLEQVVLSVPGGTLQAHRTGLRFGYRHDLPALDEPAAFATVDDIVDGVAADASSGDAWDRLEEAGDLAALAHVRAFDFDRVSSTERTQRTLEVADQRAGRTRRRSVAVDLSGYPGTLSIDGDAVDRLGGITHDDADGPMTSGAIALSIGGGRTRDQMDIGRGPTHLTDTMVRVEIFDGDTLSHEEVSLRAPFELAGAGTPWALSFQNLPMRVEAGGSRVFDAETPPGVAPEREFDAHRWHLHASDPTTPLSLGGLEIHPVRLFRVVTTADGALAEATVDARLQLPYGADRTARPDRSGLVRLVFRPMLADVALIDGQGVWPLVADATDDGGVQIRWASLAVDDGELVVGDASAHFHLFDAEWSLSLDGPLRFPIDAPADSVAGACRRPAAPDGAARGASLDWTTLDLQLDLLPDGPGHRADLHLALRLGDAGDDARSEIEVQFTLRPDLERLVAGADAGSSTVSWFGGRMDVANPTVVLGSRSIQVAWDDMVESDRQIDFIAGATLSDEPRPGAVTAGFGIATSDRGWPELVVDRAHAELVFGARWTASARWDDPRSVDHLTTWRADRPGAWYAGDLSIGYVGGLGDDGWGSEFVLDGIVELASLISFAGTVDPDRAGVLRPVPAGSQRAFTRHGARILFQQHRLDQHRLAAGDTLLELVGPLEFGAVVEHVLTHFELRRTRGRDRLRRTWSERFTTPQVVRLSPPADARDRLARLANSAVSLGGVAVEPIRHLLDAAYAALPDDALVVEASVSALIDRADRTGDDETVIRTLPAGALHVARASIDDHAMSEPYRSVFEPRHADDGHLQLNLPFLAVVGAGAPAADGEPSLASDPVDQLVASDPDERPAAQLASALAGRPLTSDDPEPIAIGDGHTATRTFAHIAERSLVANWHRLASTEPEIEDGVASVVAAAPDAIARMATPAALERVLLRDADTGGERPEGLVAFEDGGLGDRGLVEYDFRSSAAPRGLIRRPLRTIGPGWRRRSNGLTLADGTSDASLASRAIVDGAAAELVDAIRSEGAFSIHLRVAASKRHRRTGAIVSLSDRKGGRLFTLGERSGQIVVQVRNNRRDRQATRGIVRTTKRLGYLPPGQVVDVAYVFDGTDERIYVDGEPVRFLAASTVVDRHRRRVDFSSWTSDGMRLMLGNETEHGSRWSGRWEFVACYAGVVTPADVGDRSEPAVDRPLLPWASVAAQLDGGFGAAGAATGHGRRHIAAAIVPSATAGEADLIPSPYVSFGIASASGEPADEGDVATIETLATIAELLAEDDRGELASIGGRLWERSTDDAEVAAWAAGVVRREVEHTRRIVVRLRRIRSVGGATPTVTASYAFRVLPPPDDPTRLGWRALPLRAAGAGGRQADWHFREMPAAVRPANEIAAPIITGATVVRDIEGPDDETEQSDRRAEVASASGLVLDAAYAAIAAPVDTGPVWHGVSHRVQFAESQRPGALDEPDGFDVAPRIVLAPLAPEPALPDPAALPVGAGEQAVALDAVRYLLTGGRPGAMTTVRAIRQSAAAGRTDATASVPTQIRAPRPLPMPFSIDPAVATRTWGGSFDRNETVRVEQNRFDIVQVHDGAALLIEVVDPPHGTVARDRTEPITVDVSELGPAVAGNWVVEVAVPESTVAGAATRTFKSPHLTKKSKNKKKTTNDAPATTSIDLDVPTDVIGRTQDGDAIDLVVTVTHTTDAARGRPSRVERRTLVLPLTVVGADALPLVVEPRFCRFEDPEYNRRISTAVGRKTFDGLSVRRGSTTAEGWKLTISHDRSAYLPGAAIVVGARLDPDGSSDEPEAAWRLEAELRWGPPDAKSSAPITVQAAGIDGALGVIATATLPTAIDAETPVELVVRGRDGTTITGAEGVTEFSMKISIVAQQETPATTAAYALLRRAVDGSVSCPRYALRPTATRIQMVDRRDVFGAVMRYRAEFNWTDTVRAATLHAADGGELAYEIQKISALGETHVPLFGRPADSAAPIPPDA